MQTSRRTWLIGAGALGLAGPGRAAEDPFSGVWSTSVVTNDVMTRFLLELTPSTATLVVIDTGGLRVPAASFTLTAPTLKLTWSERISMEGRLSGPDQIEGIFEQDGARQPFILTRGAKYRIDDTVLPPGPLDLQRLKRLRRLSGAPAMGAAFAYRGQKPTIWVDGLRSVDATVPVSPGDAWHIGSDTKSMTATLVARMVEAGRLQWTTTIDEVLGQAIPDMHSDYRGVTLLHLLSHTGGLPREIEQGDMAGFAVTPPDEARKARAAFVALGLQQPPIGPKGQTVSYSNLGYVAVGAMLEAQEGAAWEALMRRHVFSPLKLNSAGFGAPGDPRRLDQPFGHLRRADGQLHSVADPGKSDLPFVYGPAGLVHSSLADTLTYLAAHRDRRADFLREETWRTLQTPPFEARYMALGWGVGPDGELGHTGSNGQWWHQVLIAPKTGLIFCAGLNAATPEAQSAVNQAQAAARLSAA